MFQTSIGPSSNYPGYLRPETAQGQFLNFAKLLEFNQSQMPFASASIGKSYRNEISPRAGLLRVREFLMAEIEHFVDPEGGKKHHRFHEVEDVELVLLDRDTQLSGKTQTRTVKIGQAVKEGLVDNETLGYFLARIHQFLQKIGIDMTKLRFRQHMANEMAHYACDCWDAELFTSSGWIECVGCADRSAYDLSVHAKKTGAPLVVREQRETPLVIEEWQIDIERKKFGPQFKKDAKTVEAALLATPQEQREKLAKELSDNGSITLEVAGVADGKVQINKDSVAIEFRKRVENTREFVPNVIEPSFGIGRILYSLMEHSFWTRGTEGGDEARGVRNHPFNMLYDQILTFSRSCRSLPLLLPPRFSLFPSLLTLSSSLCSSSFRSVFVVLVSPAVSMIRLPVLASDTAETTSLVLLLASRLTSRPRRMALLLCETVTAPTRSELSRRRLLMPSNHLWMAARPGPRLRASYPSLRVRRLRLLHDKAIKKGG
jgi:dimeric type glycyl-tRNA synthetase